MKRFFVRAILPSVVFLALGASWSVAGESILMREFETTGVGLYDRHCSECHGLAAVGTGKGPTLIHRFYHPNHHSDWSFRSAVANGVKAHHWGFGDMPKVPGLGPDEVDKIISYIRGVQKEAGVFK